MIIGVSIHSSIDRYILDTMVIRFGKNFSIVRCGQVWALSLSIRFFKYRSITGSAGPFHVHFRAVGRAKGGKNFLKPFRFPERENRIAEHRHAGLTDLFRRGDRPQGFPGGDTGLHSERFDSRENAERDGSSSNSSRHFLPRALMVAFMCSLVSTSLVLIGVPTSHRTTSGSPSNRSTFPSGGRPSFLRNVIPERNIADTSPIPVWFITSDSCAASYASWAGSSHQAG